MMKLIILAFVFLLPVSGGWKKAFKASLGALTAATVADTMSSYGKYELNPVLGRGTFGAKQTAIKFSITGGLVLVEYLVHRKTDKFDKAFTVINFAGTGVLAAVAVRNTRLK